MKLLVVICMTVVITNFESNACSEAVDARCYHYGELTVPKLCVGGAKEIEIGGTTAIVTHIRSAMTPSCYRVALKIEQDWVTQAPSDIVLCNSNCTVITLHGDAPGKTALIFSCLNVSYPDNISCPFTEENLHYSRRQVSVARSLPLDVVIIIVGWIYALCGIFSFYPQIIHNFRRSSVEGLSFDFLGLNFTGGLAYAMFNIGLLYIPQIKEEYFQRHPGGVNPVLLNDVAFSVNAAFAQGFIIFQCFILKRGEQKLSYAGILFIIALWLVMIVSLLTSIGRVLQWLDFLYIISYIKLVVTVFKYIPQVWTNIRLKNTDGFSVGYTILEITGGSFSIFQMFLLSFNYDDWKSIIGDPTKFGFGLLTVFFDLILIGQYFLYDVIGAKKKKKKKYPDKVDEKIQVKREVEPDIIEVIGLKRSYPEIIVTLYL